MNRKELESVRVLGDIKAANAALTESRSQHNWHFAKPARDPRDAHRPVAYNRAELEVIFSLQHEKRVSPKLEFQHQRRVCQNPG